MYNHQNIKVLLVEDNDIVRMATISIIEDSYSCNVESAENGEIAVKLLLEKPYDLILMDIGLGEGLDGYQVTEKIRHASSDLNKITPIIALTAHSKEDIQQKCFQAGMQDVILKPLTPKAFQLLIEQYGNS